MSRPFIYIGAIRRTGSTLLAEALTDPPHSFIFREPRLARRRMNVKPYDADFMRRYGIDLTAIGEKWKESGLRNVTAAFGTELYPLLCKHLEQVGVKEIRNGNWREYSRVFPGMKVVLLARDPRDICISLHYRALMGATQVRTVKRIANKIHREFQHQKAMSEAIPCLKVRYEDLCTDPGRFEAIKEFVESPIPTIGMIGRFLNLRIAPPEARRLRAFEVTDERVRRWQREENEDLVQKAFKVFDRLEEYCAFWGYSRD